MGLDNRNLEDFWIGGEGGKQYDADSVYPDDAPMRALRGPQVHVEDAPTEDTDVVRKQDLATLAPDLSALQLIVMVADAKLSAERVLAVTSPLTKTDGGAGNNVTLAINGQNVTTQTFVTSMRFSGTTLQMQTRTLTFTSGVLTAISSTAWSNVPTV